jgi:hypothetical protein
MTRPPIPDPPYSGGCLCGAVRYRLEQRPQTINACHCDACKKMSGGTNLLMVSAPRAAFRHLSGDVTRFRRTADSGRQSDVVRCTACGTRLWHEPAAFPIVLLAAGTLDDSSWAVPASHIWVEKAVPAYLFQSDATRLHGQPDRQAQLDAFNNLYGNGS